DGAATTATVAGSFQAASTTINYARVSFTGAAVSPGALTLSAINDNPGYGTADFSPASGPVTLTLSSLDLYGGLSGTDNFVVGGAFTWTAGSLSGPAGSSLTALAGMTLNPAMSYYYDDALYGRQLVNQAGQTASFTGGDLFLYQGARFTNAAGAVLDIANGGYIGDNIDGNASLDNAGTVEAHGPNTTTVQLPVINEPGALIPAPARTLVLRQAAGRT